MTVKLMEGYDHYQIGKIAAKGWSEIVVFANAPSGGSGPTWGFTTGRILGQSLYYIPGRGGTTGGSYFNSKPTGGTFTQFVVGFAFRLSQKPASTANIFKLRNGTTDIVVINITSAGLFLVQNGSGTTMATGTFAYTNDSWVYLEFKVVVNGASGSIASQVNGAADIGTTTCNFGSTGVDNLAVAPSATSSFGTGPWTSQTDTVYWDDIYFLDTSASPNNNFLGDVAVETLYPNGAGAHTQWTPDSGSNYARVNEHATTFPDDDTSYVADKVVNDRDSYTMTDLTALAATIYAVQPFLYARKDNPGTRQIAPVLRPVATDRDGTTVTLGTSYIYYTEMHETNPDTSTAWTQSDVNACEIGVKMVA